MPSSPCRRRNPTVSHRWRWSNQTMSNTPTAAWGATRQNKQMVLRKTQWIKLIRMRWRRTWCVLPTPSVLPSSLPPSSILPPSLSSLHSPLPLPLPLPHHHHLPLPLLLLLLLSSSSPPSSSSSSSSSTHPPPSSSSGTTITVLVSSRYLVFEINPPSPTMLW